MIIDRVRYPSLESVNQIVNPTNKFDRRSLPWHTFDKSQSSCTSFLVLVTNGIPVSHFGRRGGGGKGEKGVKVRISDFTVEEVKSRKRTVNGRVQTLHSAPRGCLDIRI